MSSLALGTCFCGKEGTLACARCGLQCYCSEGCQERHCAEHLADCGPGPGPRREFDGKEVLSAMQRAMSILEAVNTPSPGAPKIQNEDALCGMLINVVGPEYVALDPVRAILLEACRVLELSENTEAVGGALRRKLGA